VSIRDDANGQLGASLRREIAIGRQLERLAVGHAAPGDEWHDALCEWRAACLTILRSSFERETTLEFARATRYGARDHDSEGRMVAQRIADGLAYLVSLEASLRSHKSKQRRRGWQKPARPGRPITEV
jgi:hypothetical protein